MVGPFKQRPTNRCEHFWIVLDVFDFELEIDVDLGVVFEN